MKFGFQLRIYLFVQVMFCLCLNAAETDAFTNRYMPMQDAMEKINEEMDRRIELSLTDLQQVNTTDCDWKNLDEMLGRHLRRPFSGQIESYINDNPSVPRFVIPFTDSIYRSLPLLRRSAIWIGTLVDIGFATHIAHDGLLIGSDKFGHFLDEGYYYYFLMNYWGSSKDTALKVGNILEAGPDGGMTSGIYSYADLAANYDGYLFWTDVLGPSEDHDRSKYFSCRAGVWKIKQPMDIGKYLNPAWDEGMNCNEFRSESMTAAVNQEVEAIEKKQHRHFACPVFTDRVQEMIARYGTDAHSVIHPKLFTLKN